MKRFASQKLDQWLHKTNRKPLIIRGARQVGKTWLVHDCAKRNKKKLIELNFEKNPNHVELFTGNQIAHTMANIEAEKEIQINPENSILFLDEIQAAPELLSKLRWFKEELSDLPVIAAGSLLEFALADFQYSVPVGRLTYLYLEQMSFLEFILAQEKIALYERLCTPGIWQKQQLPESLHEKAMSLYQEYCLIGGMPEVVDTWITHKQVTDCIQIQQDLLSTYRDDFHKYGGKIDPRLLSKIMMSVSRQLGNKFVYSHVDATFQIESIKKALHLLSMARVCTKIMHTSGNGIPLGAETNEKFFKTILLDIGLIAVQLGLSSMKPFDLKELILINKGGLAEQFVGQQIRIAQSFTSEPQLYYWQKTKGGQAELDYIIQFGHKIVPIEIKSGKSGSMKSLHQFMHEKKLNLAVRFNANLAELIDIKVKTTQGQPVSYVLLSLPVYLAERIYNILDELSLGML